MHTSNDTVMTRVCGMAAFRLGLTLVAAFREWSVRCRRVGCVTLGIPRKRHLLAQFLSGRCDRVIFQNSESCMRIASRGLTTGG